MVSTENGVSRTGPLQTPGDDSINGAPPCQEEQLPGPEEASSSSSLLQVTQCQRQAQTLLTARAPSTVGQPNSAQLLAWVFPSFSPCTPVHWLLSQHRIRQGFLYPVLHGLALCSLALLPGALVHLDVHKKKILLCFHEFGRF